MYNNETGLDRVNNILFNVVNAQRPWPQVALQHTWSHPKRRRNRNKLQPTSLGFCKV